MANENNEWLLTASDLTVRYNTLTVLDGVSMTIQRGDRIGLVGHNGSGKSTFIRILAGVSQPDSGAVSRRKETIAGYLPQDFTLNSRLSVRENIRQGAGHVLKLIHEFEALPPLSSRHDVLEKQIEVYDGWNLENRIESAMTQLNCPDGNSRIETLSGGEKRRVALCRALVMQPDLLILDEPTNHLDAESIEWLCEFLKGYPNAFLMVTHDRYFLDEITRSIVELARGKFYSYSGNYTDYLIAKSEREALAEAEDQKRQSFLRRELEWVRTQPRARTTKSKSRLDRYFETAGTPKFEIDQQADVVIPPAPPLGNKIVKLAGVGMELGGSRLFEGLDFNFEARHRIGVVGRNGLGKTTLLKIIMGEMEPVEGKVVTGLSTRFNYVDQGRLQLDEEKTLLEQISEGAETIPFGDQQLSARGYLKRFLFPDDRIQCQVKVLSGGERSRLLLARILKNGGNFLILDEPTNDLDLPTLRVLEEALVRFEGVVLAVSHDRYFLNRVCNGILAFEGNGRVAYSEGNYDYYLEKKRRAEKAFQGANPAAFKNPAAIQRSSSKSKPRKLSYKETQELEGMEEAILEAEENIRRIEARFADPDFHRKHGSQTDELKEEMETARAAVAGLYARWEELEAVRIGPEG